METAILLPETELDLPVHFKFSFRPFVAYLRAQRQRLLPTEGLHALYGYLIDQFSPFLTGPESAEDWPPGQLDELFQLATVAVLPLNRTNDAIPYAFGIPMPLRLFHGSDAFKRILNQFPDLLDDLPGYFCEEDKQRMVYQLILERGYGVSFATKPAPSFQFQKTTDGLTKYFRVDINTTFMEPRSEGTLPPLHAAWVEFVNGTRPYPDCEKGLPIDEFGFEGFAFFQIEDITEAEAIQQLEEVFVHLQTDTEPMIYRRFETALRNLFGQPNLQISLVPFPQVNGIFVPQPSTSARSVMLRNLGLGNELDGFREPAAQQLFRMLAQDPTPRIHPDLQGIPEEKKQALYQKGIRSFLWYPVVGANEGLLGLLEMASPEAEAFREGILPKLERISPLIQELLRYQLGKFSESLERLIKKKFTPLQPAVAWKFYDAAWEHLHSGKKEPVAPAAQVRFPAVYPLYGAIDIRNSSTERNRAIRQDLTGQLAALGDVLTHPRLAGEPQREAILAGYQHWKDRINTSLTPEDELGITEFLTKRAGNSLRDFRQQYPELEIPVAGYLTQTEPESRHFMPALRAYERSLEWINSALGAFLEGEERQLQAEYPHYFEKYRTDGLEYTMYVGQSIAPRIPFSPELRRRLYGWQLSSMVDMARLTHRLLPSLPQPVQTTQLILAHSQPVDIGFRQDEHRFDVEGSYSIRYEVLKKRIDKVRLEGTQERLTQPDTIALVYNHAHEVAEYLPMIQQLQQAGKLAPSPDYLHLEKVQGIDGLKALRLRVRYEEEGFSFFE